MRNIDWIGWTSSGVLLALLIRQVLRQWRSKSDVGVSKWLFVGQLTASVGYVLYSLLLRNWMFVASNIAILATAIVGQVIFSRNRRLQVDDRKI